MKKDDFSTTSLAIMFMIIMIAFVFLGLLILPEGRLYEATKVMLPVLPVIILIVATMLYVKATFNMLHETQLERKKSFIEEMIKKILLPIHDQLTSEISFLKSIRAFRIEDLKSTSISDKYNIKNHVFLYYKEIYYKIFRDHYNELHEKIEIHDKEKLPKFQEICNDLINKINDESFNKKWKKNFVEYQSIAEYGFTFPRMIDGVMEFIIHGGKALLPELFYKKYKNQILRERENHKKDIDYLNEKREEIKNYVEEIKKNLVNKITEDLKTYGILPTKVHFDYP